MRINIIVDTAPGKNDFGVVADFFGLVGEIVGVDAAFHEVYFCSIKVEPDNIIFQGKSMRQRQAHITQADYRDLCPAIF